MYICKDKIGKFEVENGKLSYQNLINYYFSDLVLCNNIIEHHDLELISNVSDGNLPEDYAVYQWFIVEPWFDIVEIAEDNNLLLFYCDDLDVYVLGVDHFGTSWDYVLTDIDLEEVVNY